jgi:hypothetical protein
MKDPRRGEKLGWTLGWAGGFLWVAVLAVVAAAKGDGANAAIGALIAAAAFAAIAGLAPWRHPARPYWQLLVPVYLLFAAAVVWAIRAAGGAAQAGFGDASLFVLLPILLPFFFAGRRRWSDGERRGDEPAPGARWDR